MARTEKQELVNGERYNRLTVISFSHMDVNDFKEWAIKIGQKAMAEQWGNFIKS